MSILPCTLSEKSNIVETINFLESKFELLFDWDHLMVYERLFFELIIPQFAYADRYPHYAAVASNSLGE